MGHKYGSNYLENIIAAFHALLATTVVKLLDSIRIFGTIAYSSKPITTIVQLYASNLANQYASNRADQYASNLAN